MPRLTLGLCPSLNSEVLERLKEHNLLNINNFVIQSSEEISKKTSINYKDVCSIKRFVLLNYSLTPISGSDLYQHTISNAAIFSTGLASLDNLLDGGLYTSEIVEICGSEASGKTQLCLQISASFVSTFKKNVYYIDTKNAFDAHRFKNIICSDELDCCLKRLTHVQATDIFSLLEELELFSQSLSDQAARPRQEIKLLVIDCVSTVISPILGNEITNGYCLMTQVVLALRQLLRKNEIVVLVTNTTNFSDGQPQPALGPTWLSVANTRLQIINHKKPTSTGNVMFNSERRVRLTKSCNLVTGGEARFVIETDGLKSI